MNVVDKSLLKFIMKENDEIIAIVVASIKTAKKNK